MSETKRRSIQFIDLKAQQERIREKVEEGIKRVLDHGKYIMGPEIKEADIDPVTYNLDPTRLEKVMRSDRVKNSGLRVRGIIPVDLFGQPADYKEIEAFAKKQDLFVLEDAAQAFGAEYNGARTCSFGDVAATSFFPAKPFGCYGDGGAIFTNDDELAAKMHSIRVHGQGSDKYDSAFPSIPICRKKNRRILLEGWWEKDKIITLFHFDFYHLPFYFPS